MTTHQIRANSVSSHDVHISVVIPVYGCSLQLEELYMRLCDSISNITKKFEIIMVNDQSPDNAWGIIVELAKEDDRVRGINLSRNFGQHCAITAGLDYAVGDWVVIMDCDLQDQPEEIIKLYNEAVNGYDVVFAQRKQRKDRWIKRCCSFVFYKVLQYFSAIEHDSTIANFSIYSRKVVDCLKRYHEQYRSIGMFLHHIGFSNRKSIPVAHAHRKDGVSAYTYRKKFKLALDTIVAHSSRPLEISVKMGFFISFISIIYIVWIVIRYYIYGINVAGWTSLIASVYLIGGIVLINIGVLGMYIGKIYEETKKRPLYHVQNVTFNSNDE